MRRFATRSLKDARILRVLAAALEAVEPGAAVRRALEDRPLPGARQVYALAIGKAAIPMLEGLAGVLKPGAALGITKHREAWQPSRFPVMLGGHPVPDERSVEAGQAALEFAARLRPEDLLVCLISGGGSALMSAPRLPLEELKRLTTALLASGARIDEINTLRRHLDAVKGGGLAAAANGARVVSLILSDVVGDPLEAIASGPTAPDPTHIEEAREVLRKYGLEAEFAGAVVPALKETIKPGEARFERVENRIIGSNDIALKAAMRQAEAEGFAVEQIASGLQGEAREAGAGLARRLKQRASGPRPFCLLAGGETTVTLQGKGRGGRNQETALAALPLLEGAKDVFFISLATDGEDGPTDAAGAVATGESMQKALALGLDPLRALGQNDSYPFFEAMGDLIRTGPSGTNVNDLMVMVGM